MQLTVHMIRSVVCGGVYCIFKSCETLLVCVMYMCDS